MKAETQVVCNSGSDFKEEVETGVGSLSQYKVSKRLAKGPEALTELYALYSDSYRDLRRLAQRIVGSQESADDVVQQAFLNTADSIKAGTEIQHLGAYLKRCIYNLAIKRVQRPQPVPFNEELARPNSTLPEEEVGRKQSCKDVYSVVGRLTPAQRSAFLLAELHGYRYGEIANTMERSEMSVRQLLSRARSRIRDSVDFDAAQALVPTGFVAPLKISALVTSDQVGEVVGRLSDSLGDRVVRLQTLFGGLEQSTGGLVHAAALPVAAAVILGSVGLNSEAPGDTLFSSPTAAVKESNQAGNNSGSSGRLTAPALNVTLPTRSKVGPVARRDSEVEVGRGSTDTGSGRSARVPADIASGVVGEEETQAEQLEAGIYYYDWETGFYCWGYGGEAYCWDSGGTYIYFDRQGGKSISFPDGSGCYYHSASGGYCWSPEGETWPWDPDKGNTDDNNKDATTPIPLDEIEVANPSPGIVSGEEGGFESAPISGGAEEDSGEAGLDSEDPSTSEGDSDEGEVIWAPIETGEDQPVTPDPEPVDDPEPDPENVPNNQGNGNEPNNNGFGEGE